MIVKINGSVFDTERVMRFAPHKKGAMDFAPDDVRKLFDLEQQKEVAEKDPTSGKVWTVDRMGWRFLFWRDEYGNTIPQCFAPLTGEMEYPWE